MRKYVGIATSIYICISVVVWAGIPEPDTVLYGHVFIDGVVQQGADDVTVLARVDMPPRGNFPGPEDKPVGTYELGSLAKATGAISTGDCYLLRVKLESLADGSTQTPGAAVVGDSVRLCLKKGSGEETCHPSDVFEITARGQIARRDVGLRPEFGDWNLDSAVTVSDMTAFTECMKGPGGITSPQCLGVFDSDGDTDVDHRDSQVLLRAMGVQK